MAENSRDQNSRGIAASNSSSEAEQMASDAEGVWSPDIEQSFQEALAIYPPCGRRKIILSDEGKMYGRNELIARYIKLRTGKTRSRKQVSSHIQVLARRKRSYNFHISVVTFSREKGTSQDIDIKNQDSQSKDKALQAMAMSSPQIISPNSLHPKLQGVDPLLVKQEIHRQAALPHYEYWSPAIGQSGSVPPPPPPVGFPYTSAGAYYASAITHATAASQAAGLMRTATSALTSPPPTPASPSGHHLPPSLPHSGSLPNHTTHSPTWQSSSRTHMPLRLIDFSAYIEQQRAEQSDSGYSNKHLFVHLGPHRIFEEPDIEAIDIRQIYDKFPEKKGGLKELYEKGPPHLFFLVKFWADLNTNISDDAGAFYGVSSIYESSENMTITCSTKVCSFGKQVVEKVETEHPRYENGRFVYRIHRSPMCEYMINFIHKLKHLPEKFMMNSVLENFTILQVVSNRETQETLLCLAFVFEVSSSEHGAQHHIYKLVKD